MTDRFWSKVDKHGPRAGRLGFCWLWMGARSANGYGNVALGSRVDGTRRNIGAHCQAWMLEYGPDSIPEGMCVLHHCDNPPCVRRSHLWLGTKADNQRDMGRGFGWNEQKTHCPAGHLYNTANTYHYRGLRHCRACRRIAALRRYHARRAA